MIGSAVVVRLAFLLDQGLNMGGILDPIALVVAARMAGQDLLSIDDTHPVGISKHGQRSPHMAVWQPSNRSYRSGRRVSCQLRTATCSTTGYGLSGNFRR